jgi:carbon monoxide dehydrogenase subunit G
MSNTDDNYIGIILEEIRDQNKAVLEAVGDMQQNVALIPGIKEDTQELKQNVRTIKTAVTATNKDMADLDTRVTILEQVSA